MLEQLEEWKEIKTQIYNKKKPMMRMMSREIKKQTNEKQESIKRHVNWKKSQNYVLIDLEFLLRMQTIRKENELIVNEYKWFEKAWIKHCWWSSGIRARCCYKAIRVLKNQT